MTTMYKGEQMTIKVGLGEDRRAEVVMRVIEEARVPGPHEPDIARVPTVVEWIQIVGRMARLKIDEIELGSVIAGVPEMARPGITPFSLSAPPAADEVVRVAATPGEALGMMAGKPGRNAATEGAAETITRFP
jgi:hypothetical protein